MADHLDEQEELENFKHFWHKWGRWLFAVLIVLALGYLAWSVYQNHQKEQNQEAAAVLAQLAEKMENGGDVQQLNADLQTLQAEYPNSIAAAQASLMLAASEFDKGNFAVAEGHLNWVLKQQKDPFIQTLAVQRLAVVKLQQKQYDEALKVLQTSTAAEFAPILAETKGDVYAAQGKSAEAVKAYDEALAALPEQDPARELLNLKAEQLR